MKIIHTKRLHPAEIYRLRLDLQIERLKIITAAKMLFNALWLKAIQTQTNCLFCTTDNSSQKLKNLYHNKLFFKEICIVKYKNSNKNWIVFNKDCISEKQKGTLCPANTPFLQHFYMEYLDNIYHNSEKNIISPIHFSGPYNLLLKEYNYAKIQGDNKKRLLEFSYPKEMFNREKEISTDIIYTNLAMVFIVFEMNNIVGSAQFLSKNNDSDKLPIEYSFKPSGNGETEEQFDFKNLDI